MFGTSSSFRKIVGMCFLMTLFVSFASAYLHIQSMAGTGSTNMPMPGCPFMNESAVMCSMDPIQHIAAWQHMFTTTPQMGAILLLALIIACAFARTQLLSWLWKIPDLELSYRKTATPLERYTSTNYLQEIFSQGILNPKLF